MNDRPSCYHISLVLYVSLFFDQADVGISLGGGGSGGVSIYDVFSGASSRGEQFINVYKKLTQEYAQDTTSIPLKMKHVQTYLNVTSRVKEISK
jgi:hypothetical protein